MNRRDRKREASRERLYQAALTLFVRQGFDVTTIDQIAAQADVARATAFNYFPQKVAYLQEWGRRRRAGVAERLIEQRVESMSTPDRLRAYLTQMAQPNESGRAETVALMEPSLRVGRALRTPTLDAELAALIIAGQRSGDFRPGFDANQAGQLLGAAYFAVVLRWVDSDPAPFDLTEHLLEVLDLVLVGLR